MSSKTLNLTEDVYQYLLKFSLREAPTLQELRAETRKLSSFNMQIAPEQGQFMALLVELLNARKTLDIGTFTGYSALVVAKALPEDGKVISCDVDNKATAIAKRFWQKAKVDHKIELCLAPAIDTLKNLLKNGEASTFDFSFIDADKRNYAEYYELSLQLIRRGGLIAIDNVLWGGAVADPKDHDATTDTIRELNAKLITDERITMAMVPIGDGLTLVRKR